MTFPEPIRYIPHSYASEESRSSALKLVYALLPGWETVPGETELVRFKEGITNTLLKVEKRQPDWTQDQIDDNSVLLRAYGKDTEILIDRAKETTSHSLLASLGLAPPLLARFDNGLLYRFIKGKVCSPADLRREEIWTAVARRIAEWHARVPLRAPKPKIRTDKGIEELDMSPKPARRYSTVEEEYAVTPGLFAPNVWTVMQKWIFALPTSSETEVERKARLQRELEKTVGDLAHDPGLGMGGFVFSHNDLLSGNVIVHPKPAKSQEETVSFIDYEYGNAAPAAFDLANHFAEWGGFECEYKFLPARSTRKRFLEEYLQSYRHHQTLSRKAMNGSANYSNGVAKSMKDDASVDADALFAQVDRFRGIPGFYWGIWALIQAQISQIDFDYASYAETRLGEYFAWRAEYDGSRKAGGGELCLREKRWAEE